MSVTIYATKAGKALFGFNQHDEHFLAPDAQERAEQGQDIYEMNPEFIRGAGFDMSEGNFMELLDVLGLPKRDRELDALQVIRACDAFLPNLERRLTAEGKPQDERSYFHHRMTQLRDVAVVGMSHGADRIVAH